MVVFDTSTLLFHLFEPEKLSKIAVDTIDQANEIIISAISIWEIGLKVKKGKLNIPLSATEMVKILQRAEKIRFYSVDVETWLENVSLDWHHQDPADRTIVATARLLNCPLITSDMTIRDFYETAVW
ncbi:type II toxin-antitoxin system VapC family toxin [Candidatus Leptofilum sp.]|uniref:type II toxin-antitoxin system VapC family toxin n=1 Tax=Candidatus Leptofilum sp. TaxID=3241576 RepID=UPI003B5A26D2